MAQECSICTHSRRAEIDQAIARGDAHRAIAREFGVSRHALDRHKKNGHIAQQIAKAEEKRKIADADKLLGIVEGLLSECLRTIKEARGDPDSGILPNDNLKLRALREARETAKLLLDVQGKTPPDTVVNITLIENQWNDFRTAILGAMCPDCREAVTRMLRARQER
jgi:transposase-like protein